VGWVSFDPDGNRIAVRFSDRTWDDGSPLHEPQYYMRYWDTATGEEAPEFEIGPAPDGSLHGYGPQQSRDGKWLVTKDRAGVHIVEAHTLRVEGSLSNPNEIHEGYSIMGERAGFAPDGKTLVVVGYNPSRESNPISKFVGQVVAMPKNEKGCFVTHLWDAETCKELGCFDDCHQIQFSADGRMLATAHADGTLKLWDLPLSKPMHVVLGISSALWAGLLLSICLGKRFVGWLAVRCAAAAGKGG
jgi:WD40 repeat protein